MQNWAILRLEPKFEIIFNFYSEHPQRYFGVGHSRDTLGLGTPGTLWGWGLQGTPGILWAGRGTPGTRWVGTLGDALGWAPQGHSGIGDSRDTLGLGTPGMSEE